MSFETLKSITWKWYHFVVFWLPGGMFLLAGLIALQTHKNFNKV